MSQWWNQDGDTAPVAPTTTPRQAPVHHGHDGASSRPLHAATQQTATQQTATQQTARHETERPSLLVRSGANAVVLGAMSGVVAGLVGVGVGSLLAESSATAPGIIVGFLGATLGLLLNGWADLSAGYVERGLRNGIIGSVVATIGGLVGLAIADAVFYALREDPGDLRAERIALIIGWLIIGTLIGVGIGALGGRQKAASGLLGGAVGGGLGGVLFVLLDGTKEADGAMLVGALVAAATVGISVGSVQRLRRRAWAIVLDGPLAGREFILYRDVNRVGSSDSCEVSLPGDAAILPVHLTLRTGPPLVGDVAIGATVALDGKPFSTGEIQNGAVLQLGSTFLEVHRS